MWSALAFLWAAYYFVVLSLGRYPAYTRLVIWTGGGLMVASTLMAHLRRPSPLPKEGLILLGFSVWSLTGVLVVTDWPAFIEYFRISVQMAVVVICLGIVLRRSGHTDWMYLSFLLTLLFNVLFGIDGASLASLTNISDQTRQEGMTGNPNAFGFYGVLGLLAIGALSSETRSRVLRAGLIASVAPCLYAVVVSGSRGAFVAISLAALLWPLMCFRHVFRGRVTLTIGLVLALGMTLMAGDYVIQRTYLGARVEASTRVSERQSAMWTHIDVRLVGLRLFAESPVIGVGLGQFGEASGTGMYAHSEVLELLADTGLVGLAIHMSVYLVLWRRLARVLRQTRHRALRYRAHYAQVVLIVLVVSGVLFRPNFLGFDTIFLTAVLVGTAGWLEEQISASWRLAMQPAVRSLDAARRKPCESAAGAEPMRQNTHLDG